MKVSTHNPQLPAAAAVADEPPIVAVEKLAQGPVGLVRAAAAAAVVAGAHIAAAADHTRADSTPVAASDPTMAVGPGRALPAAAAADGSPPAAAVPDGRAAAAEFNAAAPYCQEAAARGASASELEEEALASREEGLHVNFASECIDGAQAPLCDALAVELAQQLELIVEDNEYLLLAMEESSAAAARAAGASPSATAAGHAEHPTAPAAASVRAAAGGRTKRKDATSAELEIEGRLGILVDVDTGMRFSLPFTSVALLSSSFCPSRPAAAAQQQQEGEAAATAPAPLRFEAGVNEKQFGTLQQLMAAAAGSPPAAGSSSNNSAEGEPDKRTQPPQQQQRAEGAANGTAGAAGAAAVSRRPPSQADEADDDDSDWEDIYDRALQAAAVPPAAAVGSASQTADMHSSLPRQTRENSSRSSESDSSSSSKAAKSCSCVFCEGSEREEVTSTLELLRGGLGWEALEKQETEEEYHDFPGMSGTRLRLSYAHPKQQGAAPLVALWKENLLQWNLYMGKDSGEEWLEEDASWSSSSNRTRGGGREGGGGRRDAGVRTFDCRVAVNVEHHVDAAAAAAEVERRSSNFFHTAAVAGEGRNMSGRQQELLRRIRRRQSFVHPAGLRVDLTQVYVSGGAAAKAAANRRRGAAADQQQQEDGEGRVLYEVETEMHPQLLLQAVQHKKQTGDAVPLLALCESFLFVLHGLAARLNTAAAAAAAARMQEQEQQQEAAAAAVVRLSGSCRPSAAAAARYVEYLSPCLPLLGDYCYNAVAPALHRAGQPPLHTFLQQVDPDRESCYTSDTVSLVGPWVPCLNEKGQLEFAALTSSGFLQ